MMKIERRELAPGVQLLAIQTNKFKTNLLGVTFLDRLSDKTAAENALLPNLLRRGTKHYSDMESLSAAMDVLYGGSVEPIVRKKGETHCIGFVGSFLDDAFVPEESRMLEEAIALMGEILLGPKGDGTSFDPGYLQGEKENLIRRIRARVNDKQQYAMYRLVGQMCQQEVYGVDKLGELTQVEAIDERSAWARYEALKTSAPLYIYYCGSAEIDRVEAAFRCSLAPLLAGERSSLPTCVSDDHRGDAPVRYFEDQMDVLQGKLTMGFRLGRACTLPEQLAPLLVFNAIYGGSTNAKLFLNVREKLSLCYYASSALEKHKGLLFVSSGVAFDKYEQARQEILAQLDDCKQGKITEQELESARRYIANYLRTTLDAQGRLEDYWLAQMVAGVLDTPEELSSRVEQVTAAEVQQVAQSLRLDSVYFLNGKEAAE